MPPNEPITESIDELVASTRYSITHRNKSIFRSEQFILRKESGDNEWMEFNFSKLDHVWVLKKATMYNKVIRKCSMLNEPYGQWFAPFLRDVVAQAQTETHSMNSKNK